MTEMVLDTRTLPEPIMRMIHTKKVKILETSGEFMITPIREESVECPLLGMFSDGKISANKFMAQKVAEKELEI